MNKDTRSTRGSRPSSAAVVRIFHEDPESIFCSVIEKKPKQLFRLVKSADATAGTSHRFHWVYNEVLFQQQQCLKIEFDEEHSRIFKAVIDSSVLPLAVGHVQRTVDSFASEVAGFLAKRQITDLCTTPDRSHLEVGLADLSESALERGLRTQALSEAAHGDPRTRLADRPGQGFPAGMKSTLEGQVGELYHKREHAHLPASSLT